jgi:hypothetical protein
LTPGSVPAASAAGSGFAPAIIRPDTGKGHLKLVSCWSRVSSHCSDVRRHCTESKHPRRTSRECLIRWEDCMNTSRCLHGSGPRLFRLDRSGLRPAPPVPCPQWIFARSRRAGCNPASRICVCVVRGTGSAPGKVEVMPPRK